MVEVGSEFGMAALLMLGMMLVTLSFDAHRERIPFLSLCLLVLSFAAIYGALRIGE